MIDPQPKPKSKSATKSEPKTPNPVDIHVGSRVKLKRTMAGMSQEKLGDQLGITFQQVQKYEKGKNRIGASRLQDIALILNTSVAFFFEGLPGSEESEAGFAEDANPDYTIDFLSSAEGIQLNKSFAKIKDPLVRKKIIDLVRSLGDEA